jgi:hypothetical protein
MCNGKITNEDFYLQDNILSSRMLYKYRDILAEESSYTLSIGYKFENMLFIISMIQLENKSIVILLNRKALDMKDQPCLKQHAIFGSLAHNLILAIHYNL